MEVLQLTGSSFFLSVFNIASIRTKGENRKFTLGYIGHDDALGNCLSCLMNKVLMGKTYLKGV